MKDEYSFNGRFFDCTRVVTERYGISATTMWRWTKRGWLPAPIRIGNMCFYDRDLVEAIIAKGHG